MGERVRLHRQTVNQSVSGIFGACTLSSAVSREQQLSLPTWPLNKTAIEKDIKLHITTAKSIQISIYSKRYHFAVSYWRHKPCETFRFMQIFQGV